MLEINDVHAGYGSEVVLKGVTLRCGVGEVLSVIGPNGAGKSTLLRTISGLVRPSHGSITWKGAKVSSMAPHRIVRAGIGHVQEGRALFAPLTVRENLRAGGDIVHRKSRASYRENLERVLTLFPELRDRQKQLAGTLSGGQQQMVAVARGMMSSPSMLMLDEPSLGLAPIVIDRIYDTIVKLKQDGVGLIIVEPSPERALAVADTIAIIESGSVVRFSSAADFIGSRDELISLYFGAAV